MTDQIVVLDEQKMLTKIQDLPNQFEKAWTSLWIKDIGIDPKSIDNVLICGMGGSGIAGSLAQEFVQNTTPLPILMWSDYGLPAWVDEHTLVIAISYSGDTEETTDAIKTAVERQAKVIGMSHTGKVKELAAIHGFFHVVIDYDSPPRAALGWLYGSVLTLLAKLGLTTLKEENYFQALQELKTAVDQKIFLPKAEDLVVTLNNKVPIILAHAPLSAVAKRWVNQFNENSKTLALAGTLPEFCHNTIIGLDFAVPEKLSALFIESSYGFSRNILRKKIIQKILTEKEIPFTPLSVKAGSLLAEQWLLLYFGDLLSYYLAGVYGIDPTPIESITSIKEELKKA